MSLPQPVQIQEKVIGGHTYRVVPILPFIAEKDQPLIERIKQEALPFKWNGSFLQGVEGLDGLASALFGTSEIGIIYTIDGEEPNIPLGEKELKAGNYVELLYIEKHWTK